MRDKKNITVWHLNHSDLYGGAARAVHRIHRALVDDGISSSMHVMQAKSDDNTVFGPRGHWEKGISLMRSYLGSLLKNVIVTSNPTIHSAALFPSKWPARVNNSSADIIHLHWIAGEMLSVKDISKIQKPTIWTLHDMWAFCGAEHIANNRRWRDGYSAENRPEDERGFDINRWTWQRKKKYWGQKIQIVTPSQWLADCVRSSALMQHWPVEVIPNALDTSIWFPVDQKLSRQLLDIPEDVPLIVFGAFDGTRDPNKGFDLLEGALDKLKDTYPNLHVVIFGEKKAGMESSSDIQIRYKGHFYDDISLRVIYSASDAVIVPSRLEAFGQTVSEAMACSKPVVAFNIGGIPEILTHKKTGWLTKPFDIDHLAAGISWILENRERREKIGEAAREFAEKNFSSDVIASKYLNLYHKMLENGAEQRE